MSDEVVIDGSHGEGGGQIIRTALSLSAITGRTLRVNNIRANRPKPGLASQHLTGLRAIQKICGAQVEGDEKGSTAFSFRPGSIAHGNYRFDVGTAGSITLVLQTVMPALASIKGESKITVTGGTDVKWSPPVDYYRMVLFPLLKRFGLKCELDVKRRGYYPQGGGEAVLMIKSGCEPEPVDCADTWEVWGVVNITGLDEKIADRVRQSALLRLPESMMREVDIDIECRERGPSVGVGLVLSACRGDKIIGASSLGERGKPAEKVGEEAVDALIKASNFDLDVHTADQILPYMALTDVPYSYTTANLTGHVRTNIWTIERFMADTFDINEEKSSISCKS